jgi:hypothetical protein
MEFECLQPTADPALKDVLEIAKIAASPELEQSEVIIETHDTYPFNNYMGQGNAAEGF